MIHYTCWNRQNSPRELFLRNVSSIKASSSWTKMKLRLMLSLTFPLPHFYLSDSPVLSWNGSLARTKIEHASASRFLVCTFSSKPRQTGGVAISSFLASLPQPQFTCKCFRSSSHNAFSQVDATAIETLMLSRLTGSQEPWFKRYTLEASTNLIWCLNLDISNLYTHTWK